MRSLHRLRIWSSLEVGVAAEERMLPKREVPPPEGSTYLRRSVTAAAGGRQARALALQLEELRVFGALEICAEV